LNFSLGIASPASQTVRSTQVSVYACPSDSPPKAVSMYDCGTPPAIAVTIDDASGEHGTSQSNDHLRQSNCYDDDR
jgi:hypothetical protein